MDHLATEIWFTQEPILCTCLLKTMLVENGASHRKQQSNPLHSHQPPSWNLHIAQRALNTGNASPMKGFKNGKDVTTHAKIDMDRSRNQLNVINHPGNRLLRKNETVRQNSFMKDIYTWGKNPLKKWWFCPFISWQNIIQWINHSTKICKNV